MINNLENNMLSSFDSKSYISSDELKLSEILKDENNISVWRRNLSSKIINESLNLINKKPQLQFSNLVNPTNTREILSEEIGLTEDSSYLFNDISKIVHMFCNIFDKEQVWLRLDAIDGPMCPRFHVDSLKCRLVTTYVGPATQWLPHDLVNREKLGHGNDGLPDEESGLYLNNEDIHQLDIGDVALLKGENWNKNEGKGLVHRSPHQDGHYKRLYMTIDFMQLYLKIYQNRLTVMGK